MNNKEAIQDMKRLLQLVEKRVNGELEQADRDELEKNAEKWEESISVLREEILNNRIYKCKACGQKIRVPKNKCLEVTCPKCNKEFTVDDTIGRSSESTKKIEINSESGYEEELSKYEKNVNKVQYYDGTDISKECADKVGVKKYIELDKYLVFFREKVEDDFIESAELIRCSKSTGEDEILDMSSYSEINEGLLKNDTFFLESKSSLDGYEKYLYFIHDQNNICRFDVETQHGEIISFENKIAEMRVSKYYVVVMYEGEDSKLECYNLKTKEKKVLNFDDRIRDLYLFEKKVYFFAGDTFCQKDIETEILCKIDEYLGYDKRAFLYDIDNIKYYDGILYSRTSYGDLLFIDVNNPLTIQKLEMMHSNKKIIWGYKKIYYLDIDARGEIGFYDILTKEKGIIKEKTNDIVVKFEEGVLIKKTSYLKPMNIQIVGKWLYYESNDYRDREEKCIEVIL